MDSYKLLMAMATSDTPMAKIKVRGGLTEGRLLPEEGTKKKNVLTDKPKQGKSYAQQIRNAENDDEDFREMSNVMSKLKNAVNDIDDLTSMGTIELRADQEKLDVYGNYSFERNERCASASLPIHEYKNLVLEKIHSNPVVLIKGPTGCGKSTQVPQFILDEAREDGVYCNIAITQPRRIAAIKLAERVCDERNWPKNGPVGYQVSLEKSIYPDTRITYCTAGVLLHRLVGGRDLTEYTHIIVDEIHERNSETDFLLIILKKLMSLNGYRSKLILMSATLTADKFTAYFARKTEPPVIELPNIKRFRVDTFYYNDIIGKMIKNNIKMDMNEPSIDPQLYALAGMLVTRFHAIDSKDAGDQPGFFGSVLIFLPGVYEIDQMYNELQTMNANSRKNKDFEEWNLCPMHSTMSHNDQRRIFEQRSAGTRKIIIATNIAESSITLPDVKYVIDFCLTKQQVQDNSTFYSSLQLAWVSKSEAAQRAGRVGRTMIGRVYRLVPKDVFDEFEDDCDPEILRCRLDSLVLSAKELDMGPPRHILGCAIDPPDLTNIERTILNLKETGALTVKVNGVYEEDDGDLTFIGRVMSSLPLPIQLSKLILVGHMLSVLQECVIMACCLSGKTIFANPLRDRMRAYDTKFTLSRGTRSDPITYYSIYQEWRKRLVEGKFDRSGAETEEQWGSRHFVNIKSLREVYTLQTDVFRRLTALGIVEHKIAEVRDNENLLSLLMRIAIAGAFYPNYFVNVPVDEVNAVRMLGNRDPFKTVYLRKFPQQSQPGPLYRDTIRELLRSCGVGIKVQFDTTSKVYIEFGGSFQRENDDRESSGVPGKILNAVYRAVKMRLANIPMEIPMLSPQEARRRAKEAFGTEDLYTLSSPHLMKIEPKHVSSVLPGCSVKHVRLELTHIVNPSHFYATPYDQEKTLWIHSLINVEDHRVFFERNEFQEEMHCLAGFSSSRDSFRYYRAKILKLQEYRAEVLYIDYGNTAWVEYSQIQGYGPTLIERGVRDEPPQCISCRLAEIQPVAYHSGGGSQWNREAIDCFKQYFKSGMADAQIYSIVNGVMALYLFPAASGRRTYGLSSEDSFNHILIKYDHAQLVEEPYLSREDHSRREKANDGDISSSLGNLNLQVNNRQTYLDGVQFKSPSWADTKNGLLLEGPFSPLEMRVVAMTRTCTAKSTSVEYNSVNSVLLDDNPMDSSSKLLVAAAVHQSPRGDRLTLRDTTMMPSIKGFVGLMCLIFAPYSELRVDSDRTHFTGALCGLGFNEDGMSYDQENDVEVSFDCKFDLEDIILVNKIRYRMNDILCGDAHSSAHQHTSKSRAVDGQERIISMLKLLITNNKRPPLNPHGNEHRNNYEWNLVPEIYRKKPTVNDEDSELVFPLIWGVTLMEDTPEEYFKKIKNNLGKLKRYAQGIDPIKTDVKCELCQKYMEKATDVDHHLLSSLHQGRVRQAFGDNPFPNRTNNYSR